MSGLAAASELAEGVSAPVNQDAVPVAAFRASSLHALCASARFHQVAANPATLAHQLGLQPSEAITTSDLLRAAEHLGLKAKVSSSSSPCYAEMDYCGGIQIEDR
jgi:hypothetical protein